MGKIINAMDLVLDDIDRQAKKERGKMKVADEKLKDISIDIIGVNHDLGAGTRGSGLGAEVIRLSGLINILIDSGYYVSDYGDLMHHSGCNFDCEYGCNFECNCADESDDDYDSDNDNIKQGGDENFKNLKAVNRINSRLYEQLIQILERGHFPLVLGGDHSIAAASVTAIQAHYQNIGVIWVDAHGDFNDNISSPTGNIHGMPLSAVTGNGPNEILPFKSLLANFVDAKKTVIISGRDFDTEEARRIKRAGVSVFTGEDIACDGMETVIKKAIDAASKGTKGIYLSFDMDAIDPLYAPGVGTPVDGGLTEEDAELLCAALASSGKLLGAEFVELNPILDVKNKTGKLAVRLIAKLLPGHD